MYTRVFADYELIDFAIKGDERGSLVAFEENHNVPFDIKRVYYIFDTKANVSRGNHAHTTLKQVLICTSGNCKIRVNDGKTQAEFLLNKPDEGLYIGGFVWREMYDFSPDCVLLVLANEYYDEGEYIRNYSEFLSKVNRR